MTRPQSALGNSPREFLHHSDIEEGLEYWVPLGLGFTPPGGNYIKTVCVNTSDNHISFRLLENGPLSEASHLRRGRIISRPRDIWDRAEREPVDYYTHKILPVHDPNRSGFWI